MGLAVEVGHLAFLIAHSETEGIGWHGEAVARVNAVLEERGLPRHEEPKTLPSFVNRAGVLSYPYGYLHYLRRFAAYTWADPNWKPVPFPEEERPTDDLVLDGEMLTFERHLLCHSDCEGFYLPIDFPEPIFADEKQIPGGMLGSSQGLMRELVSVAPYLGIELLDGRLPDTQADRINSLAGSGGPFHIELMVWVSLFEAARLSIEYKTAIVFN